MTDEKNLPSIVAADNSVPQVQSSGLLARGLEDIQQAIAISEDSDPESLFRRGMLFKEKQGATPQDDENACRFLLAAAKQSHAEAQYELIDLLGDATDIIYWLQESVSQAFGPAQDYLARNLNELAEIDSDLLKRYDARKLYEQAFAWYECRAIAGDAKSQYSLALLLLDRNCPFRNTGSALQWMRAAAEQDHKGHVCERFGRLLLEGRDVEQGVYWLSRAAEFGQVWACKTLADLYLFGNIDRTRAKIERLIVPDKNRAIFWCERRIENEKKYGALMGLFTLAHLYLMGEHLEQNLVLAEKMLLDAGNAGSADSQRWLAKEYISGERLEKNSDAALYWLQAYYQNPYSSKATAAFNLGDFYENHSDDAPNYSVAIPFYRESAELGGWEAQRKLMDLCAGAKGQIPNIVEACMYGYLAAAFTYGKAGIRNAHSSILASLDELRRKSTHSQQVEAAKLAENWIADAESLRDFERNLASEGLKECCPKSKN